LRYTTKHPIFKFFVREWLYCWLSWDSSGVPGQA
jgi:hypothetical protein